MIGSKHFKYASCSKRGINLHRYNISL